MAQEHEETLMCLEASGFIWLGAEQRSEHLQLYGKTQHILSPL